MVFRLRSRMGCGMERELVCENGADLAKRLEVTGARRDPWGELTLQAERLVARGLSRLDMEEALMQFVRQQGWPEKMRAMVSQIVQQVQQQKSTAEAEASRLATVEQLEVVPLAEVEPRAVRWLWPGKIPLGTVTVIYGEAAMGKTSLVLDLAARVSRGAAWPDGTRGPGMGEVLILNGEDHLDEMIVPRLTGSDADLTNVAAITRFQVGAGTRSSHQRRFSLERDLPALREQMESLSEGQLVIIDSLEAFCGTLGRAQLRAVLAELDDLAVEYGVAIVVVSAGTKCDLPAKNVWRVDCDVLDAGLRCWVPVRCNWGPLPAGLAFRVTSDKIMWETRAESPTADRSRGATSKQEKSRQLKDQAEWLKTHLADGPLPAKQVVAAAGTAGWSAGQVRRAREALRLVCSKETTANGQWVWELPNRSERSVAGLVKLHGERSRMGVEGVEDGKDVEDVVRVSA